jgi:hypothetical protein
MVQNINVSNQQGINPQHLESERTEEILVRFTPFELEFLNSFTKLLSNLVDPNGNTVISDNNPVALIRFCVTYISAIYQTQIFPDSRIINMFSDKDTKKEFIAFRAKYMNMPNDLQIQDLKRLGIVKPSKKAKTQ